MFEKAQILWVDDEIGMLKAHILYLEDKGYEVTPVNSGEDAIQLCDEKNFDFAMEKSNSELIYLSDNEKTIWQFN